ncbi:hypothetical protein HRR78_002664 [Exophiala dermatitidis]|nr:hypothetical protein HRR78_002664 [Exophiala dermatitidis]
MNKDGQRQAPCGSDLGDVAALEFSDLTTTSSADSAWFIKDPDMPSERRPRRLATSSTRSSPDRKSFDFSNSTTRTATPSPTLSTNDTRSRTDPTTSHSDSDESVGTSQPQTASSADMAASVSDRGRRTRGGRVRKLTAKAQALSDRKADSSSSPPPSDTIVVSSSPPPQLPPPTKSKPQPRRKQGSTTPSPSADTSQQASGDFQTPETSTNDLVESATSASNAEVATQDETNSSTLNSPARRTSQRERKPSAKALLTPPTARKRPASPADTQDVPARKSARISYGGAKVPSKLRYSLSSSVPEELSAEDQTPERSQNRSTGCPVHQRMGSNVQDMLEKSPKSQRARQVVENHFRDTWPWPVPTKPPTPPQMLSPPEGQSDQDVRDQGYNSQMHALSEYSGKPVSQEHQLEDDHAEIRAKRKQPTRRDTAEIPATPTGKKSKRVTLKTTPTKVDKPETAEVAQTTPSSRSKVITLKSKRLSEINNPTQQPEVDKPSPKASKVRASRRKSKLKQDAPRNDRVTVQDKPLSLASCDLSCLPPWSRLVAFAEIAKRMPDSDNDDEEIVPGSDQDWRSYTQHLCQCKKEPRLPIDDVNASELARALLPNTVFQGTQVDPIDLTEAPTAESELLAQPVNTILRATDAERLSQLFASPHNLNESENRRRYTTSATRSLRNSAEFGTPPAYGNGNPLRNSGFSENATKFLPTKRTYEERMRDDHKALADIRKRASALGIEWNFNMTFDDISSLVREAEASQTQIYYDQRNMTRENDISVGRHGHGSVIEGHPGHGIPAGYGGLYPGKATSSTPTPIANGAAVAGHDLYQHRSPPPAPPQQQQPKNGRRRPKSQFINYNYTHTNGFDNNSGGNSRGNRNGTGTPETAGKHLGGSASPNTTTISFVTEDIGATYSSSGPHTSLRRPSSPSRPKSSRFRVDPRGLLGESPGPGTIINIDEQHQHQHQQQPKKAVANGRASRRRSRGSKVAEAQKEAEVNGPEAS